MKKQRQINEGRVEALMASALPGSVKVKEVLWTVQMAKGLPLTAFERLILHFIYAERIFMSIEEVFLKFKAMDVPISISTVQLCVKRFYQYGVLTKWRGDGERLSLYGPVT